MRRAQMLALMMGISTAVAAPFVVPAAWLAESPATAKPGGEFRSSLIGETTTMNPFSAFGSGRLILEDGTGLFTQDPTTDQTIPLMAEAMPRVSNDGTRFVVRIRQGMKFSDGTPITADDWITTYKIHTDEKVGSFSRESFFLNKKPISVQKLDSSTLQFDFPQVSSNAYALMSYTPWPDHVFGPVYQKSGAEGIKAMWGPSTDPKAIVTPGAWMLNSLQPGQGFVLQKNPYFGEWFQDSLGRPLPYLDTVNVRLLKDREAVLKVYLAGEIDVFGPTTAAEIAQIRQATESGTLKAVLVPNVSPEASSNWIVFNWNKASAPDKQTLFRDVRFRQAISHLVNRAAMVQQVLGGLGSEVYTGVYPVFSAYQFASTPRFPYDPKAAATLLAQLGFTRKNADGYLTDDKGKVLEFDLATTSNIPVYEQLGRLFANEARAAGVKVNFSVAEFNTVVGQLMAKGDDRPFDAVLQGLVGANTTWPYNEFALACGGILHAYDRPADNGCLTADEKKMSDLYYQGDQTLDNDARRKVGEQLSRVEAELQPFVYLVGRNYHVTYASRLGGEYRHDLWNSYHGSRPAGLITTYIK